MKWRRTGADRRAFHTAGAGAGGGRHGLLALPAVAGAHQGSQTPPARLVESTAMADASRPFPKYVPKTPREVVREGRLSEAQLEAITYVGDAHSQHLPNGKGRGSMIGGEAHSQIPADGMWRGQLRFRRHTLRHQVGNAQQNFLHDACRSNCPRARPWLSGCPTESGPDTGCQPPSADGQHIL